MTRRTRTWILVGGGAFLLVVLGVVAWWVIRDAVATARVERRLDAIRAAGDPVTMAELAELYPPLPPERNAAPMYQAAFLKMKEPGDDEEERLPIVGLAELPPLHEPLPPEMLKAVRAHLAANAEALPLLHKAAAKGECWFELDFPKGKDTELPHLTPLHEAARLLALQALEHTETGGGDEAAGPIMGCLRVRLTLRAPFTICGLIRWSCTSYAIRQTERWVNRRAPSPAALQHVQEALGEAADPELLARMLVSERCLGIDMYDRYLLKPSPPRVDAFLDTTFSRSEALVVRLIPKAKFKADLAHYLDRMNDVVAAARKPYPTSLIEGERLSDKLASDLDSPKEHPTAYVLLRGGAGLFRHAQKQMTRLDSARVALAALRYRAQHGSLPAALDDLVPEFLDAVPADPYDGQPLRYRTRDDGFVVYAVGRNGEDDGGTVGRDLGSEEADIGFRVRRPETRRPGRW